MLLGNVLQRLELPCRHGARTNISNPALLDDIVQSLHDLLSRCASVQAMDLENVDVCAQSLHALLYGVEDVLATQADFIDRLAVIDR